MEVECEFKMANWYSGQRQNIVYCGEIISIVRPGASVTIFKGIHQEGKTNRDVEYLSFIFKKVEQFPRGIENFFPSLTCFILGYCGLKEISRRDLLGLENLQSLFLHGNQLKALPDDLFENMTNLEQIAFYNNEITRMSSKLFEPLNKEKLILANFKNNPSIDYRFDADDGNTSLDVLLEKIDQSCELFEERSTDKKIREKYEFLMKNCEKLYVNGSFSDYTINVRGEELKVHKFVLSAQSSVFKAMFMNEDAEEVGIKYFNNVTNEDFKEFFHFFYSGKIENTENATQLFGLAVKFDVPQLKLDCEDIIVSSLQESNMIEIYNIGRTMNSDKLKREAFEFIQEILNDVTDNMLDEHEMLNDLVDLKRRMKRFKK